MKNRSRAMLLCLAVACTACGGLPWVADEAAAPSVTVTAVEGAFEAVVTAKGELEAMSAKPVAVPPVPTGALKVKELVEEGSLVEPGDVVVRFDDSQLNIDLANHTASIRSVSRRMARTEIQAAIESGTIGVLRDVASLELGHANDFLLDDETIYSQLEILDNSIRRDEAEETILFAKASLQLRGEYYDIDERILDVEREKTSGKIGRVQASLGKLVLRAPIGGIVVYKKNWRGSTVTIGDSLWPGNVLMSIVDPTKTSFRTWILEGDATGITEGAEASIRIDAHSHRVYSGRVESVAKLSRPIAQGSPVKYFEAVIEIDDPDAELLKPGMRGEARITVARADNAITIPRSALLGSDEEPRVLVEGPAGAELRAVKVGVGDRARVTIEEGLAAGEQVILGRDPGTSEIAASSAPSGVTGT